MARQTALNDKVSIFPGRFSPELKKAAIAAFFIDNFSTSCFPYSWGL